MNPCHSLNLTERLHALFALASFAPEDDEDDDLSPAGDDGDVEPANGAAGEQDGDEDVKHRIKQLSDEAAKHRRLKRRAALERAEKAEARVVELESAAGGDLATENRTLHLRLAFERASTAARVHDAEAAWLLVQDDLKGVTVERGQVDTDRICEIAAHVVDRYPYLVGADEDDTPSGDGFPPSSPSGRIPPARSKPGTGMDNASLARKFPALGRR